MRIEELEGRVTPALAFSEFVDPHPAAGNQFGASVVPLSTVNVVVTSPFDDAGAPNAGAVYLFNGTTGALISTLLGSHSDDNIGVDFSTGSTTAKAVTALTNGNFAVRSVRWDNGAISDAGAVTFGNGSTGVSGVVSAGNSLVGSSTSDVIGEEGLTPLANGNYVVSSAFWNNGAAFDVGAVTLCSGTTGLSGVISAANSLIGGTDYDSVGDNGVTALSNGNYIVSSTAWQNGAVSNAGAVTFGNGVTGVVGAVSAANSLVGSTTNDQVGYNGYYMTGGVQALGNGNYVVSSPGWDNGSVGNAGAVTLCSGVTGVSGTISAGNSLVGSSATDRVGDANSVTALSTGNYVVGTPNWHNASAIGVGAATFGNGISGVSGVISAANSLVGSHAGDGVGGVAALGNGNYVAVSPNWDNGATSDAGAPTFGSGATGVSGTISSVNSLVGSHSSDRIGLNGVKGLNNGGYVVVSPNWTNGAAPRAGAVTFGAAAGISGVVSSVNSLVGSRTDDQIGAIVGVTVLSNGNYVVGSPYWDNGAVADVGAVTFGNGSTGVTGVVSAANSLVGSTTSDGVYIATALSNGNYIVSSANWDNGGTADVGAVTFGNGASGTFGVVGAANSLIGSAANDLVGSGNATPLAGGKYAVGSPHWHNVALAEAGAVTFVGAGGMTGAITVANSLVGSTANDQVGSGGVTALSNGNYVVSSPNWDNGSTVNAGAATFGGASGIIGAVSAANSLVGSTANDQIGNGGVTAFANGNYAIVSSNWDRGALANAGAVTFGSGSTGASGVITGANSALGTAANTNLQPVISDTANGDFDCRFVGEAGGKVRVGSQIDGFTYSTTTALSATPLATTGGNLVMLTATVSPSPGVAGTVTFRDNGVAIAAGTNVPLSGGVAVFSTSAFTVGNHPLTASYNGSTNYLASPASNVQTVVISAVPPPVLTGIAIDGGAAYTAFAGIQRSMVVSLQLSFDRAVTLDPGAFALTVHAANITGLIPSLTAASPDGGLSWIVTFSGANTDPNVSLPGAIPANGIRSLVDGVYDFAVNGTSVRLANNPTVTGSGTTTQTFYRLFGEVSGEEPVSGNIHTSTVNTTDNLPFRTAFNTVAGAPGTQYQPFFDFDGDGQVNTTDNLQFRNRFNWPLSWTT